MKRVGTIAVSALLLVGIGSDLDAGEDQPNSHIRLVLSNLAEKNYRLPAGDYVLLAQQPQGVVEETVVYDLDAERIAFVPETHSHEAVGFKPLSKAKTQLLREIAAMYSIQSLARDSGQIGLDGSAFVVLIRLGGRTRMIGHWSPNSPALELLADVLDRELRTRSIAGQRP